jgi:methenyltetrahydromethanopterin cyclohydrolase
MAQHAVSVSAGAARLVDGLVADAETLGVAVSRGEAGELVIDLSLGGLEAGRRLAEVCLGGLGTVSIDATSGIAAWPWAVTVRSARPVIACLGSQYGGWTMHDPDSGFFALGSGPARALAGKEAIFADIGYADRFHRATLVIEGDRAPPPVLVRQVAEACGVAPADLAVLFAPTGSLAGSVQITARVLEVALHKAHTLHFPMDAIVDGMGVAPLPPPVPDFVPAMGRTNDAIIYGGRVQLFVRGTDDKVEALAHGLPSRSCAAYGRPFAAIFAEVAGDFYKIDPMLFSPAEVIVSNLDTGRSFSAGAVAPEIVEASFR